jgi:hypothetical protein
VQKILHFKNNTHKAGHLDDFTAVQAEFFVVIENGVHALNPNSIHRTVKEQPLPGWASVSREIPEKTMLLSVRETNTLYIRIATRKYCIACSNEGNQCIRLATC